MMKKNSKLSALVLGVGLLIASPASAQKLDGLGTTRPQPTTPVVGDVSKPAAQGSVEERLAFSLSGYEYFPKRAELDQIADAATIVGLLLKMASDEAGRPMLRLRAVDALGLYQDEAARAQLKVWALGELPKDLVIEEERMRSSVRHRAIMGVARSMGEGATPVLKPLLKHEDLQIQLTTVSALGSYGGESGRAELARLKTSEKDPILLRELRKHVP
jgi:hypothetical protein